MMKQNEAIAAQRLAVIELDAEPVRCVCPRCGRGHTQTFCWTGRGVPRVYCPRCRKVVERVDVEMAAEGPGSKRAGRKGQGS